MSAPIIRDIPIDEVIPVITQKLKNGGIFLTTPGPDHPNTMTIGWGGIGTFFNRDHFFVPVRKSRYTYGLLEKAGVFTLSIPLEDMREALAFAGTRSGRDVNKFECHGLTALNGQEVAAPIIGECGLHLECRITAQAPVAMDSVSGPTLARWYGDADMHTLFFGEVLRCYETK